VIDAASIAVSHCDCGNVHIALYDVDGVEVARASMPAVQAADFTDDLISALHGAAEALLSKARPN
jgi:hypothetical protein